MALQRFPIRLTGPSKALAMLNLRPSNTCVAVGDDGLREALATPARL